MRRLRGERGLLTAGTASTAHEAARTCLVVQAVVVRVVSVVVSVSACVSGLPIVASMVSGVAAWGLLAVAGTAAVPGAAASALFVALVVARVVARVVAVAGVVVGPDAGLHHWLIRTVPATTAVCAGFPRRAWGASAVGSSAAPLLCALPTGRLYGGVQHGRVGRVARASGVHEPVVMLHHAQRALSRALGRNLVELLAEPREATRKAQTVGLRPAWREHAQGSDEPLVELEPEGRPAGGLAGDCCACAGGERHRD
mmetsp:Transcript_6319/g.26235  ORF Transcript_6319/g.26235 Transcript_6319/m.26235 type:complete len:256 (-) Transcript_6319:2028-2795(-)